MEDVTIYVENPSKSIIKCVLGKQKFNLQDKLIKSSSFLSVVCVFYVCINKSQLENIKGK